MRNKTNETKENNRNDNKWDKRWLTKQFEGDLNLILFVRLSILLNVKRPCFNKSRARSIQRSKSSNSEQKGDHCNDDVDEIDDDDNKNDDSCWDEAGKEFLSHATFACLCHVTSSGTVLSFKYIINDISGIEMMMYLFE